MDQMEDRLPVLLRRLADEVPPPVTVPDELMRRSRRRILLNGVLTAALVAGLAVGSVTAFRAIAGNVRDRQVPASDPTPVGKIAFPSTDGGIYVVNSSGGGPVRLTDGEFPSFSPDGTRIAFTRSGQVYVMEADGTGVSRLTDLARTPGTWRPCPCRLAWSPDGTRIAFVGTRDGEHGLIIVNSDGGGTPRLVEEIPARGGRSTLSWSPDGGQILVGTNGEGFLLVDVQTGATSLLPGDPRMAQDQRHCGSAFGPAYSPDGTTIAFAWWRAVGSGLQPGLFSCGADGLFLMDADGTNVRRLTDRSLFPWGPSWSPDGTRIAFFGGPGGPTSALYVVNADSSGLTKLADIGRGDHARFLPASPSWSQGTQMPQPGGQPIPTTTESAPAETATGETNGTWPCADSQDGPPPRVCFGPLDEGTYTSQRFEPALTFTVPPGWNNPWDTRRSFDLWTPGWSDEWDQGLRLHRDVRAVEDCSDAVDPAAGTSALELATWVSDHPGIATGGPSPVEIGGLAGYQLDVSIAETWHKSCPWNEGLVTVNLLDEAFLVEGIDEQYASLRLILLDLPDGGNVLIAIDGDQVDAAMPVVRSFEFDLD